MQELMADESVSAIRVISRRPLPDLEDKAEVVVVDFEDDKAYSAAISGTEVLFCAIGTTNKKVKGDKTAYRKVDYDIPVNGARYLAAAGGAIMVLISSVGADASSSNFYTRLKGEVEDAIRSMPIASLTILRPSMLLGDRKETRIGESIGKALMKLFAFMIPAKYKPIHAREVARAMVRAAKEGRSNFEVWHYSEIRNDK